MYGIGYNMSISGYMGVFVMDMEKTVLRRTTGYLIARDVFLVILIGGHISAYNQFMRQMNIVILSILLAGALIWIFFFTNLLKIVSIARKDQSLVTAFGDEYFASMKTKAGYNGYRMMLLCCLIFIIGSIILHALSIEVNFPVYFPCEIILLTGVITDDTTKILLSKG